MKIISQVLHVWNIYLHLPYCLYKSNVGKYSIHGAFGYEDMRIWHDSFGKRFSRPFTTHLCHAESTGDWLGLVVQRCWGQYLWTNIWTLKMFLWTNQAFKVCFILGCPRNLVNGQDEWVISPTWNMGYIRVIPHWSWPFTNFLGHPSRQHFLDKVIQHLFFYNPTNTGSNGKPPKGRSGCSRSDENLGLSGRVSDRLVALNGGEK